MASKKHLALLAIAILILASVASYELFFSRGGGPCNLIPVGTPVKTQTSMVTVGAIEEYNLPTVFRQPNAITNASDGSVWFAEQGLPGVGHLFPGNGTLVEYAWPGYPSPKAPACASGVSVSGIALWNGRVWGADEFGNALVGVKPGDGSAVTVSTAATAQFPYWVAVGPDGNLWFTSDNLPARLGRIFTNMTVQVINLLGMGSDEPLQLDFVNSSLAYVATVDLSGTPCTCDGRIYRFDPSSVSGAISPAVVGPGFKLILPTSVAYSAGAIWVAQHDASSVTEYDPRSGTWVTYPTSTMPWLDVTLPLEVAGANGMVWFNEHYANKVALLDPKSGTLTEYSESDPPAASYTQIQNDESIALADGGLWVSSMSGGYVGFVAASYDPGFQISVVGTDRATLPAGGSASFGLRVSGTWTSAMKVTFSDSENFTSVPRLIQITPSATVVPSGSSPYEMNIRVAAGPSVQPGVYTVAVTVTNGLVQRSAYLFLDVS